MSNASIPVFITCRDRVDALPQLIDYLERAGCSDIYLLDCDSTYPPLLELYESTPHHVVDLGLNLGHQALWRAKVLERFGVDGRFVLTDSDIVPIEECPLDAIEYFGDVLDHYPDRLKCGFGLKIDDLPDHYRLKKEVVLWESGLWEKPIAPRLYEAPIGTTFALYQPNAWFHRIPAIRTGYPYMARHTSWYVNSDDLPDEQRFYRENVPPDTTRWDRDTLWHQIEWRLRRKGKIE